MPTIPHLPAADPVSASDLLPISQQGAVRAITVGALLAQTQPAIVAPSPSLLGRISIGPGGPDAIAIGDGLTIRDGALVANAFDPAVMPLQTALSPTDQVVVISGATTLRLALGQLRELFTAGANITIDGAGVISASASGSGGSYSLSTLAPVTTLGQQDLVAVSQGGHDHSIKYSDFLNGLTIDLAQPAGVASDGDAFWVAQNSNVMARQTLGMLWPWISGKLPSWKRRVVEIGVNTTLDGTIHNTAFLVCGSPVTISALAVNMGSGFSCDLINVGTGFVTLASPIVASNGTGTLAPNQCATIYCVTYSGGTVVMASIGSGAGTGSVATTAPGQISGLAVLSATSSTVGLSWSAPIAGGAASSYTIQYRVAGATGWLSIVQAGGTTTCTVTGLQSATGYEFSVIAANSAGAGPMSSILSVTTSSGATVPGAPTALVVSNITTTGMSCSWTPPASGGAGITYGVQYQAPGQSAWISAANNLSATSFGITGLSPATSYNIQVIASNSVGAGPASASVTATTAAAVATGLVTSIAWNLSPSGTFQHGSGAIGVNVHVAPAAGAVEFGFSNSATALPTIWTAGLHVNSDLWGAYVPTPASAGTWYAWAEGTDGSSPTVYPTPFTVA